MMMRAGPSSACPLCGMPGAASLGSKHVGEATYPLARCAHCHLLFVTQLPTPEALATYYAREWADAQHPAQAARRASDRDIEALRFGRRLGELRRHAAPPGRLLDIGCRDGAFLAMARAAGWSVAGVELAPDAAQQARARGIEVFVGTLETAPYAPASFDVITLWHVLEHVPASLPFLQRVARLLTPRGIMAIETPNIEGRGFRREGLAWEYLTPPAHLRYFGPHSLRHALDTTGYQVLMQRTEGGTGVGPQLSRAGWSGLRQWALRHYRWVWPLKRLYLACCGWLAPSDDLIICYARKCGG